MVTRFSRRAARFNLLGLGTIVGLLVLWQLLVSTKVINYAPLPGPLGIWSGLKYLAGSTGGLWGAVGHTVKCVLVGWALAVAAGALAGVLVAVNSTVASWAGATVDLFRSLPVIALIPIAILIWGTGSETEIILGAYAGFWLMLMNTAGGARNIPSARLEVARTLGLGRLATVRKIVLPSTVAAMLVGARLALATTLVVCVVSEMLGLQSGVGNQLVLEQSADQPQRVWAYILVIGTLGIIANFGLVGLVRITFPGVAAASERSHG